MPDAEILIIGAGAAGLAASYALRTSGRRPVVLEARKRVGGRIFTCHPNGLPVAVELGAEFVHGRPHQIMDIARTHGFGVLELAGQTWCTRHGKLQRCGQAYWSDVDRILKQMDEQGVDRSFADFLEGVDAPEEAKRRAASYVEGFNAARRNRISVHSLVQQQRAEDAIEVDRLFRIDGGYDRLVSALTTDEGVVTGTVVHAIRWSSSGATVETSAGECRAERVVITVPLPILQEARTLRFDPELPAKRSAAAQLEMGEVIRITVQFREDFWRERAPDLHMLLSDDEVMPTWWTTHPVRTSLITGWAAGLWGRNLSAQPAEKVLERALESLGRCLGEHPRELAPLVEHYWTHDWQSDPFSRGGYSYVRPGGLLPRRNLRALRARSLLGRRGDGDDGSRARRRTIAAGLSQRDRERRVRCSSRFRCNVVTCFFRAVSFAGALLTPPSTPVPASRRCEAQFRFRV